MKKTIIIALMFMSIRVYGQNQSIGFQCGLNLTNIIVEEPFEDTDFRKGLLTGIKYEISFKLNYTLGLDLLYSQQGFNHIIDFTSISGPAEDPIIKSTSGTINRKYDYLIIPAKIGYTFGNKIKIIPRVGICPALIVNAKTIIPSIDKDGVKVEGETIDITDSVKRFDLNAQIEIEIVKKFHENLELFASTIYRSSLNFQEENNIKEYVFSLSIGLKYRLN